MNNQGRDLEKDESVFETRKTIDDLEDGVERDQRERTVRLQPGTLLDMGNLTIMGRFYDPQMMPLMTVEFQMD